ncbi:acyl-CoA thioesterase [Cryptosporangium phraense]|uniref:Acyl-CoA thioesterase II n=1 Tax=Cryptosporangium phraense TaxID=2593070 RepID=A0A545AKV3_9ACTN|nr:acyl-CoA thioesterase domain-containing protein [Cryptosporangium phraense]TQS41943.1 acyl-CoA thioesterase II [Cryptosporangium phraense]
MIVLGLTPLGDRRFRGESDGVPLPQPFGGQLVGQSVVAAGRLLPGDRAVHSVRTTFLRAGVTGRPVTLEVTPLRDGRRVSVLEVSVRQDDRELCRSIVSAAVDQPDGVRHATAPPPVPGPDASVPLADLAADDGGLGPLWDGFSQVDVRVAGACADGTVHLWMRCAPLPDDPLLHRGALAYASDLMLMATVLARHGVPVGHERTLARDWNAVSLDHGVVFGGEARADEWQLFSQFSPSAAGGRAVVRASVTDEAGRPVGEVEQLALVWPGA